MSDEGITPDEFLQVLSMTTPHPNPKAESSFAAPPGSANECIKRGVSELLLGAINGQIARYRTEEGYIRWGLVEREIHELIDRQLPDSPNRRHKPREMKEDFEAEEAVRAFCGYPPRRRISRWLHGVVVWLRQRWCSHTGYVEDMKRVSENCVTCCCNKCGKQMWVEYGLALPINWERKPDNNQAQRLAVNNPDA